MLRHFKFVLPALFGTAAVHYVRLQQGVARDGYAVNRKRYKIAEGVLLAPSAIMRLMKVVLA